MQALGEMLCFAPIAGSYIQMAQRYIHPSVRFVSLMADNWDG